MVRFLKFVVAVIVAVPILAFAIANRQVVPVAIDPFKEVGTSAALLSAPLFVLLFLALIVGIVLGGIAAWLGQGANRRKLREARDDAERWRAEARRLREQPPMVVAGADRTGMDRAGLDRPGLDRPASGRALVGVGR